jgi:hypothetical protein
MGLEIKSYDTLVQKSYERISRGIPYDEKMRAYESKFVQDCIDYFKEREEYEKCQILIDFNESRSHEKGWNKI